ncbi:MAG: hypothetical protein HYU38_06300 [Candidatus Tectomicrobia bacterium]|nr:hypothetical protein [Candidatus Tectomicrobia bacterium]
MSAPMRANSTCSSMEASAMYSGCWTTMRSAPSSRAVSISARTSPGSRWPVLRQTPAWATRRQMVRTSGRTFRRFSSVKMVMPFSSSLTPPVCLMPGRWGEPTFLRWFRALRVGIQTIRAPRRMAVSTAKGFKPPTA